MVGAIAFGATLCETAGPPHKNPWEAYNTDTLSCQRRALRGSWQETGALESPGSTNVYAVDIFERNRPGRSAAPAPATCRDATSAR